MYVDFERWMGYVRDETKCIEIIDNIEKDGKEENHCSGSESDEEGEQQNKPRVQNNTRKPIQEQNLNNKLLQQTDQQGISLRKLT